MARTASTTSGTAKADGQASAPVGRPPPTWPSSPAL